MTYPAQLDALPTDSGDKTDAKSGTPTGGAAGYHAGLHNSANAAINSIEAILGLNPQGGSATVSDRIAATATSVAAETARAQAAEALGVTKAANLSDLASVSTARANLGLGSAATSSSAAFDVAGAAASEQTRAEGAEATKATKAALEILNLGADWSAGSAVSVYSESPAAQRMEIKHGTDGAPVTVYGPSAKVSLTMSMAESLYASGDGALGAAALIGMAKNLSTSQTQAVGVYGGAKTYSSYEGAHSLADAAGGYFVGRSVEGSRVGIGAFISGRRDTAAGRITGAEIVSDNATETADTYNGTLPGTKGIHLHPVGKANSAIGLVLGHPVEAAAWDVGIGAIAGSVKSAVLRDDSSATRSILIRGTHEKAAIAVASGAGGILVGAEEFSAAGPQLELYAGESNFDPIMRAGTGKAFASSIELKTEAGTSKWFMSASNNGFITESGNGGSGILIAAAKIFTLARAGAARGMFRMNENGIAIGEGSASSFGAGKGVIFLANASTVPTANPIGGGILYCEAGKLMYRGSSGTVKELATA